MEIGRDTYRIFCSFLSAALFLSVLHPFSASCLHQHRFCITALTALYIAKKKQKTGRVLVKTIKYTLVLSVHDYNCLFGSVY